MLSHLTAAALALVLTSLIDNVHHVRAFPTGSGRRINDADYVPTAPPGCTLLSSVTYSDQWGPLFIEDDFECDFPPLKESSFSSSSSSRNSLNPDEETLDVDYFDDGAPPTIYTPPNPLKTDFHRSQSQE